jgi:nucleoid-associated protein YgaU
LAKAKTITKKTRPSRGNMLNVPQVSNFKFTGSYTSLLYGIITVFVLFLIVVFGVRVISNRDRGGEITKKAPTVSQEAAKTSGYVVKKGDTLWSIAESQLGDGFRWGEIAKANNIQGDEVKEGTSLTMPEKDTKIVAQNTTMSPTTAVATITPTVQPTQKVQPTNVPVGQKGGTTEPAKMPVMTAIEGNSYTVMHGDNLWNISVRAYGNGFRWGEIATANSLSNPRIIHVGNVLQIPR